MNRLFEMFPDVMRYARSELKTTRVVFGAIASFLIGLSVLLAALKSSRPGVELFQYILAIQAVVLLGYGTARTAGSIILERQEGTWDLQRMTPLSPVQVAVGKLLGAPLFAFYLAATLVPWALSSLLFRETVEPAAFLRAYVALGVGTFMALSIGLVVSAYSVEASGGSYSTTTGALAGLFAVQSFLPVVMSSRNAFGGTPFFGLTLHLSTVWSISALALGVWAFFGAKWRVGKDLLEGPRWWRLPAFLLFIVVYGAGWTTNVTSVPGLLLPPALFVYMASVLNGEGADHWKRWLGRGEAAGGRHRVPVWVNGLETYLVLSAAVTLVTLRLRAADSGWFLYPFLQSAFLARDLMFLQWFRLTNVKHPEFAALGCLAFAYALPAILVASIGDFGWRFLYVPVPNPDYGAAANLAPAVAQALVMGWVLARRLRPALARA